MSTATLNLPGPLATARAGAHQEYSRRTISWTLPDAGTWHLCRYEMAWVTVTEEVPWKGEPLSLWAHRRTSSNGARESFTDKARKAIAAEVIPVVARYGFNCLWVELHRLKSTDGPRARAEQAAAEAVWWRQSADLHDMHALGLVEFVPVTDADRGERRDLTVKVVPEYHGQGHHLPVAARAMVHGEQVGWMTTSAQLIPMSTVLR